MPLPDSGTAWPPPAYQPTATQVAEAMVWYRGTADDLAAFYSGVHTTGNTRARGFWTRIFRGPQQGAVAKDRRVHVPMSAAIAQASADLLFGEMPTFELDEGDTDRLDEILNAGGTHQALLEAAEVAAGVGGVYLRPVFDSAVADEPFLSTVLPTAAVPQYRWGKLAAVTCWSVVERTREATWRHVERYEPGVILHGLYRGDDKTLGVRMGLMDHAATAGLAAVDTDGVTNLAALGVKGLGIAYVPNVGPNRRLIDDPIGRFQGRSDTASLEGVMDSLDQAYSALVREIDLAKLRIIVPEEFLNMSGRGQGAQFDVDREVFSPLNMAGPVDQTPSIETVAVPLRVTEHMDAAQGWTDLLVAGAGYGSQDLGRDADGGAQTATEVEAKTSMSTRTTGKKRGYWDKPLADVCAVLLAYDREVFGRPTVVGRPKVVWPEPAENLRDMAASLNLLNLAKAVSVESKVRMLRPDWSEDDVMAEVAAIRQDEAVMDDPTGGFV